MHSRTGYGSRPAGKRANAPVKCLAVSLGQQDILRLYTQLVGNDLGKGGRVRLPLGGDTSAGENSPIRLNTYTCPLVRANRCSLHVIANSHTQIASPLACLRLPLGEILVIQQGLELIEAGLVVAAIIFCRAAVLVDQSHIPGKLIRRNKIA